MRLGVDMHVLQGKHQGSKTYLEKIYLSLVTLSKPNLELFFYFSESSPVPEQWRDIGEVRTVPGGSSRRLGYGFSIATRRDGIDVFHSQYIAPLYCNVNHIVTIHDILFETHPQFFERSFVLRSKLLVRNSAFRAKKVLTVSQYSKEQLQKIYHLDEGKVSVTPNGVDLDAYIAAAPDAKSYCSKKYGLKHFYLTVGRLEPRKNHITLLKAHASLLKRGVSMPTLVIVGQPDFQYTDLFKYIETNNLSDSVRIISDASDIDLINLLSAARLFVYASLAEGFGIPPLEAMAARCPTICSQGTALTELFDNATHSFMPTDIESLAASIEMLLADPELCKTLISAGMEKALQYSWSNSAAALAKTLDELH